MLYVRNKWTLTYCLLSNIVIFEDKFKCTNSKYILVSTIPRTCKSMAQVIMLVGGGGGGDGGKGGLKIK